MRCRRAWIGVVRGKGKCASRGGGQTWRGRQAGTQHGKRTGEAENSKGVLAVPRGVVLAPALGAAALPGAASHDRTALLSATRAMLAARAAPSSSDLPLSAGTWGRGGGALAAGAGAAAAAPAGLARRELAVGEAAGVAFCATAPAPARRPCPRGPSTARLA